MLKPSLVVFDLDDTLYEYLPAHEAGMRAWSFLAADKLGVDSADFLSAISQASVRVKKRLGETGSSHSRLLYVQEAIEILGFRVDAVLALALEQQYWRSFLLQAVLRDSALDLLTALRYWNVPVAIVTDLTLQIQLRKLIHFDVSSVVDYLVASEQTKGDKVSFLPFEVLFSKVSESSRDNVWFVGDKLHDMPVGVLVKRGLIESGCGFLLEGGKVSVLPDGVCSVSSLGQVLGFVEKVFVEK